MAYSLQQTATIVAIITPIIGGIFYIGGMLIPDFDLLATKNQVSIVRNDAALANNETHIALMYLKYPNTPLKEWTVEDQAKYNQLQDLRTGYEKTRTNLSGIPVGRLPQ